MLSTSFCLERYLMFIPEGVRRWNSKPSPSDTSLSPAFFVAAAIHRPSLYTSINGRVSLGNCWWLKVLLVTVLYDYNGGRLTSGLWYRLSTTPAIHFKSLIPNNNHPSCHFSHSSTQISRVSVTDTTWQTTHYPDKGGPLRLASRRSGRTVRGFSCLGLNDVSWTCFIQREDRMRGCGLRLTDWNQKSSE